MYASKIAIAAAAFFVSSTTALLVGWDATGNDCSVASGNACIVRGGDPTLAGDRAEFGDGNACADRTMSYTSDVAKGIDDAGNTGFCTITVKTNDGCCVNGKCSAGEIDLDRQVVKTAFAFEPETIGDVTFSAGCAPGAFIQGELRIV